MQLLLHGPGGAGQVAAPRLGGPLEARGLLVGCWWIVGLVGSLGWFIELAVVVCVCCRWTRAGEAKPDMGGCHVCCTLRCAEEKGTGYAFQASQAPRVRAHADSVCAQAGPWRSAVPAAAAPWYKPLTASAAWRAAPACARGSVCAPGEPAASPPPRPRLLQAREALSAAVGRRRWALRFQEAAGPCRAWPPPRPRCRRRPPPRGACVCRAVRLPRPRAARRVRRSCTGGGGGCVCAAGEGRGGWAREGRGLWGVSRPRGGCVQGRRRCTVWPNSRCGFGGEEAVRSQPPP